MGVKGSFKNGNSPVGFFIFIAFVVFIASLAVNGVTKADSKKKEKVSVISTLSTENGAVIDKAGIFGSRKKISLNEYLKNLNDTKGVQIAVVTVKNLEGQDIESFSLACAEKLKLGQKGKDNGALLLVSMEDRKMRIETGYGTEGTLTDAKCSRIIRNIMVPAFKAGKYEDGIIAAVQSMASVITGDDSLVSEGRAEKSGAERASNIAALILFILFVLFAMVLPVLSRRRIGFFPFFIPIGGGHYRGGSGFGGGSSGFSGGGGSFGGGGASGSW